MENFGYYRSKVTLDFSFEAAPKYCAMSKFVPFGHIAICLNQGKLFADSYVVFWSQSNSDNNEVLYSEPDIPDTYVDRFQVDLAGLPNEIDTILFAVKRFAPEYSDHIVSVTYDNEEPFQLKIKNGFSKYNDSEIRTLLKMSRETCWRVDLFEGQIDIDALLEHG